MSEFARSDLINSDRPKVFSEGKEGEEKGVFVLSGDTYRFSIEDTDINLYEDDILGVDLDLGKAMGDIRKLNFNKVKTISKNAFKTLVGVDGLEFYFEGEQIRIEEEAFGDKFRGLVKMEGVDGQVDLLLHNNCFVNFSDVINGIQEFKNIDIYLYGEEWKKENIKKLIARIGDGKIRVPEKEGKFKIAANEKFKEDELDGAALEKLSKNMIAAVLEGVGDKASAKKLKEAKGASNNKKEKKANVVSWDKLNKAIRLAMRNFVIDEMKEKGIIIKADVDAEKVTIDEGKLVLDGHKECFKKISLVGDGMLDILKVLSTKGVGGTLLKDDKKNRDKVKEAIKEYIMDHWTYVTKEKKIEYDISMDDQKLLSLGRVKPDELNKIKEENNMESKAVVEDLDAAKQNVANFLAAIEQNGGKMFYGPIEEFKRMRKSYMLIGKEYKHKDKEIVLQCKQCIKALTEAIDNPIQISNAGMNNESERKGD